MPFNPVPRPSPGRLPLRRLPLRRPGARRIGAFAMVVAVACVLLIAGPAAAFTERARVDLTMLVVTDGSAGVGLITAQFDREGVPYRTVDLRQSGRPAITAGFLAGTASGVPRAYFQGVVVPDGSAVPAAELTALDNFERQFGLRRIVAYTAATPAVGLTTAWSGTLDGVELTVTAAAKRAGFGYLNGSVRVDDRAAAVVESYGYLGAAVAGAAFTPLVTATAPGGGPTGSLLGVYAHDGRQELVVTLAANRNQTHAALLGHGLVTWVTQGVHLGHWRNWFSVHIDDVFLADDRWHTGSNCTYGDGCGPDVTPNAPIRMVAADVSELLAWQQRQGIKLDLVFNAGGSVDAGAVDPLTAGLLANRSQLRWINHTYSHPYLGCVQDFTVVPWRCATGADGATRWVTQAEITAQIRDNIDWARARGIPLNPEELVTGEHSGLRTLPQMPVDNPNLAPALTATGVKVIAADNSRETGIRTVGSALTSPRHPMNIYYNVATVAEQVDEYNWIYTSRADGGSGNCEDNPAASTCIGPLPIGTGFADHIVPVEARIAFDHVATADPRTHYAHQSNLTEDRVLYPVLDEVLTRYRATFTTATPLVNPRFAEIALQQRRQAAWTSAMRAGTVQAYLFDGRVTVVNRGAAAVDVPITAPAGTRTVTLSLLGIEMLGGGYGEPYGVERTGWKTLSGGGGQQLLRLES